MATSPPNSQLLFPGAIRCTVWNALVGLEDSGPDYEYWWDGQTYLRQDGQGGRGAVTFAGDAFIAGVFTARCSRNPYPADSPLHGKYELAPYLKKAPEELRALAENVTLRFLFDELDGKTTPMITALFWCEGNSAKISGSHPWADLWSHGAELFRKELSPVAKLNEAMIEN